MLCIVALLPDDSYVCDCGMGMNLGLPCHHYFQVLSAIKTLKFNLGVIRASYITGIQKINMRLDGTTTRIAGATEGSAQGGEVRVRPKAGSVARLAIREGPAQP